MKSAHLYLVLFSLLAAGSPASGRSADPDLAARPGAEQAGRRAINGTELYVKATGTGQPLLILHGGPGWDHSMLLPHLAPLAGDYRLIFFDQRASGRSSISDVDDAQMTIARMVDDIDELRRDLGLDRVALLGHSFGGRIAMRYALAYPDRVSSLILLNSTAASSEYFERVNRSIQERLTPGDRERRDRLIAAGAMSGEPPDAYRELMRIFMGANFHDRARVEGLDLYVPDALVARGERNGALMKNSSPYDFYADLSRIHVPVLILRGDAEALPEEATRRIHERIPDSRLVILEDCGHFSFLECPEQVLSAIRDWASPPDLRE